MSSYSPGQSPGSEKTRERVLSSDKEQETCYICFEEQTEGSKFADPNPCNCRGTIKIHITCFDTLTTTYDKCRICKTKYLQNEYKKYYYPNGSLKEEGLLVNGLEVGLWKIWYSNGQLEIEVNYIDGKRDGLFQSWHNNGQLRQKLYYVDGKMNGLYQSWHENGHLCEEVNYIDGKLNGLYQYWHSNGQLMVKVIYVDGKS